MFKKNNMKDSFKWSEWDYMVQIEASSTTECCNGVQSQTMNQTINQTMNKTMNRTKIHEPWAKPWTINQGLTLSTIRSSFHFIFWVLKVERSELMSFLLLRKKLSSSWKLRTFKATLSLQFVINGIPSIFMVHLILKCASLINIC